MVCQISQEEEEEEKKCNVQELTRFISSIPNKNGAERRVLLILSSRRQTNLFFQNVKRLLQMPLCV